MAEVFAGGVVRERWDDVARRYTAFSADGVQTSTRAYTTAENAAADAAVVAATAAANRVTVTAALSDALVEMQTIIDATNASINQNPAAHIKTIARASRRVIRLLTNRLEGSA